MSIGLIISYLFVVAAFYLGRGIYRWARRPRYYGTDGRAPHVHPWIDKYGRLLRSVTR